MECNCVEQCPYPNYSEYKLMLMFRITKKPVPSERLSQYEDKRPKPGNRVNKVSCVTLYRYLSFCCQLIQDLAHVNIQPRNWFPSLAEH